MARTQSKEAQAEALLKQVNKIHERIMDLRHAARSPNLDWRFVNRWSFGMQHDIEHLREDLEKLVPKKAKAPAEKKPEPAAIESDYLEGM